jgi:hypothetical protein
MMEKHAFRHEHFAPGPTPIGSLNIKGYIAIIMLYIFLQSSCQEKMRDVSRQSCGVGGYKDFEIRNSKITPLDKIRFPFFCYCIANE